MGRQSTARGHREGPGRPLGSYESCGRSQPPDLGRVFSVPFRPNPTALPCGSISDAARPRIGPKQPSRGLAPRPDPCIVYCLYRPARSRKSFPGRGRSRKIDLPGERRDPGKRSPARIPRRTGENTAAVRPRHLGPLDSPQPAAPRQLGSPLCPQLRANAWIGRPGSEAGSAGRRRSRPKSTVSMSLGSVWC